jgi:hypothetical protein
MPGPFTGGLKVQEVAGHVFVVAGARDGAAANILTDHALTAKRSQRQMRTFT